MTEVKIAIIDSGLDDHISIPKNSIIGGHGYSLKDGRIHHTFDFSDTNGHGTAIGGIINYETNSSKFYIVRILNENNASNGNLMIQAIRDVLDLGVDIIHMSLGTESMEYKEELEKLVKQAHEKKILMVAARPLEVKQCVPADIKNVFKVFFGFIKNRQNIYWYKDEFYAQGVPQMVIYKKNLYRLMGGSSIAAAHLTAKIASILSKERKEKTFEEVNRNLKKECWQVKNRNIARKDIWKCDGKKYLTTNQLEIYNEVLYCVKKVLGGKFDESIPLWFQGIKTKAYYLLKTLEDHLKIKIDYQDYNFFHFFTINNLVEKIEQESQKLLR